MYVGGTNTIWNQPNLQLHMVFVIWRRGHGVGTVYSLISQIILWDFKLDVLSSLWCNLSWIFQEQSHFLDVVGKVPDTLHNSRKLFD